jgi:hypothetical protein
MIFRLKSSLILTPAFLVLYVWIGVFAGEAVITLIGTGKFFALSVIAAFTTTYCITLYVSYLQK